MGIGFTIALLMIGFIREVIGSGKLWDITIIGFYSAGGAVEPLAVAIMAPGAFIVIAVIIAFSNWRKQRAIRAKV